MRLMKEMEEGDEQAFNRLCTLYYQQLCSFAYGLLYDKEESEEVVNDVLLNLWYRRDTLKVESPKAFLLGAVRNACMNNLRSSSRKYRHHFVNITRKENAEFIDAVFTDTREPLGILLEKELEEKVMDAVNRLPELCRQVFEMSRFDGLQYTEIAENLGVSVNTVKYHMKKAIRHLSEELGPFVLFLLLKYYYSALI